MGKGRQELLSEVVTHISEETRLNKKYLQQQMQVLIPGNKSAEDLSIDDLREMAIRFLDELFFDLEEKH